MSHGIKKNVMPTYYFYIISNSYGSRVDTWVLIRVILMLIIVFT